MTAAAANPARIVSSDVRQNVLIIPSEEFVPAESHLAGIFQLHQARALADAGFQVGAISIKLALSVPMIMRAAAYRLARRKPGNALDTASMPELGSLLYKKLTKPEAFITHDSVEDIRVVRAEGFYFFPPSPFTDYLGWIRAGITAFDAYCARFGRPDVIHAHNLNPAGLLAHRISRRYDIPFVVTEHTTFFARGLVPRSLFPKLRRAANAAKSMAVVSPGLGDILANQLHLTRGRLKWIPNVIDPSVICTEPAGSASRANHFDFLCVGNLIPIKNHAVLIEAFGREFRREQQVRLRIGGDGPLETSLKALAENLGIAPQVEFLGRLSRESVIRELDRCSALVLPSNYETFGVVLIESLARGKPVIATRCGGPESFIQEQDGLLVRADDVAELSDALQVMRRTAGDYNARTLRENALARFGPEKLVESLRSLYADAVAANA